jgi:hypothetical protein
MDNFYSPEHELNEDVRKMWYVFCFHFLPKVNKEWKDCLQGSRLRKKTFIYNHITTSDEAIVNWFIKLWEPKIKEQYQKGWPIVPKSLGEGEQELKQRQKEYIRIHHNVHTYKSKDNGELACKWNDIFWEEVVANNPKVFKDTIHNLDKNIPETSLAIGEDDVLPDIDDDNDLPGYYGRRNTATIVSESNNDPLIEQDPSLDDLKSCANVYHA